MILVFIHMPAPVLRGRAVRSACMAHNHEVGGSNPPPATNIERNDYVKCSNHLGK